MKKIFLIIFVGILSTLGACSNEEPIQEVADKQETGIYPTFSDDQMELLNQLSEINESFAQGENADDVTRADLTLIKVIASADARGFKQGWQFGQKYGKGFFGKLITGGKCALMTSFIYSVCAAITYPIFGEVYLRTPEIQTTLVVTSNILGSPDGQLKIEEYKSWCRDINSEGKEEELEIAICHNLLLETYAEGTVYPSGYVDKVFSEEEQLFYKSYNYKVYHQNMPNFVTGALDFETAFAISGYEFENAIFDQYITGLNTLSATNTTDLVTKTKVLCSNYIKAIDESNTLSDESEYMMSSSIYLLPLSLNHWANR